jgi:trimethylamine--corrinoid protein Co-methyltransferase
LFEENNDSVIISDALETMDFFDSYCPYFEIEDIEPVMLCPVSLASRIRYTTKVSRGAQAAESYIWEIQLAHAAKQQIVGCMESSPPLTYSEDAINAGFAYSNVGFPVFIASGSVMGGTSPVTISGSTVSNNAELLAAVVFLQCVKPGLGIIANDFVNAMNMQSGNIYFCSLNASLHQMAFNQMWTQYYKIPTVNTGAAYPNSKLVDYQGAYEKTHIAMTSALSGANVIVLHGGVTAELSYSPVVAIIDDDIANIVGKTIEGFEVNDNTMALDMIQKVGPVPGTFLSTNHTRLHWKQESFIPKVADRLSYQEWLSNNKINVIDKAKLRMEKILATHVPEPIDSSLDREIEKILADARKYYKEKGLM